MNRKMNRRMFLLLAAITTSVAGAAVAAENYVPLAQLKSSDVPVWDDSKILAQFVLIRDTHYLYQGGKTSTPKRRLSWLDPWGGCDQRAALSYYLIAKDTRFKANPPWLISAKNFGDSELTLLTPYLKPFQFYSPWENGEAAWTGHVAPVVKNQRGELIVLDPAVNHCIPLKLNDWLNMLAAKVGGVSVFYQEPSIWKVALSTSKATEVDENENKTSMQNEYLVGERERLSELAWTTPEKVTQMLGNYPPWKGNTCVSISRSYDTEVPANKRLSNVTFCPAGTLAVGGGFSISSNSIPFIGMGRSDYNNGGWWAATAFNNTGMDQLSAVSAMCLSGAPASAKVTTVFGPTLAVGSSSTVTTSAKCSSGLLVGGGYETSTTTPIVRVFKNKKSPKQSNTWEVAAYNPGTQANSIMAFAVCLTNTSYTVETAVGTLGTDGTAKATCEGMLHAMGGGFEFPQNKAYNVEHMNNIGTNQFIVKMTSYPQRGDLTAKAYAMCLRSDSDPSSMCTAKTAVDMGAASTKVTKVAGNGCLKISSLPTNAKSITLQSQGSGTKYPIPYTWTNCSSTGKQTFSGNWISNTLSPTISDCTTVIRLTGSSSSSVYLKWWPNY